MLHAEKEKVKKLKDEKWNWKILVITEKDWIKQIFFWGIESLHIVLCYFLSRIHYYEVWLTIKVLVLLIVREKEVVIMGDRFGQ
jgi:hypothetical protein